MTESRLFPECLHCSTMKIRMIRWLFFFSLSVPLLLWYGFVIRKDVVSPAGSLRALQGYERVNSGRPEQKLLRLHCDQCALISSSGQMLGARAGSEIDQMECVIRMNNAPTKGYEKDVGSRCNIRVVSHTSVPSLERDEEYFFKENEGATYVIWGPEKNMRQDGNGRVFNKLQNLANKYPNVSMFVFTTDKVQECDEVFKKETGKDRLKSGAYLSTGFFSMILALELCDSVHVYGMIDDDYCSRPDHRTVPYHYYEASRIKECTMYRGHEQLKRGGHRFITEKAIYAKWAKDHKIMFKHPSWNF